MKSQYFLDFIDVLGLCANLSRFPIVIDFEFPKFMILPYIADDFANKPFKINEKSKGPPLLGLLGSEDQKSKGGPFVFQLVFKHFR